MEKFLQFIIFLKTTSTKNRFSRKCLQYIKILKMPSITDFCEKCHNVNAGFKNVIFGITEFEENAVTLH